MSATETAEATALTSMMRWGSSPTFVVLYTGSLCDTCWEVPRRFSPIPGLHLVLWS